MALDLRPVRSQETDASDALPFPAADQSSYFEMHIRPLLSERCYECHGAAKAHAGLRLDLAAGWLIGGDSGPAIVPGEPDESLLIQAVRYDQTHLQMPPEGRMSDRDIDRLIEWVRRGAKGGDSGAVAPLEGTWSDQQLAQAREFWSYRPLQAPPLPDDQVDGMTPHPIDRWIDRELREHGLRPNGRASRRRVLRRLSFDLHGLPPTWEEVKAFEADVAPDAYVRLVDRLLASPRFAEHWGRHWLDLVRYAESLTLRGFVLPEAWRYRDYVLEQFAVDRPLNEFLEEQLAGDLLPATDEQGRAVERSRLQQRQIATGFWALGNTNLEEQDKRQLDMDVVDEQLDVLGRAILGQTLQCARCHDHKFDPIPTRDYYALAGILRNTQLLDHANVSAWKEVALPLEASEESHYEQLSARLAETEQKLKEIEKAEGDRTSLVSQLREERSEIKAKLDQRPKALSLIERGEITDAPIHRRGSVHTLGETVPRGFLQVIDGIEWGEMPQDESGRRQLAKWVTSERQPLTPRVYANRVWYWLFGQGLVRTVDQFGTTGQPPTHPELLDHLACYLRDHDWSTKRLIRYIVLSDAYQRSSDEQVSGLELDPENRWLWRMNRRRLEAESLRDTMLMIAGDLSYQQGGPTLRPGTDADYGYEVSSNRRSVYLPVLRNSLPAIFQAFDFADPSMVVGQRATSTVPSQALFLMNDPLVEECARRAAERLLDAGERSGERWGWSDALEQASQLVLSRPLSDGERQVMIGWLNDRARDATVRPEHLAEMIQVLLASIDFRYRD